jgi:protein-disulfide isomerase
MALDLIVPVRSPDHVLGHAHAPVTLVEYGDFECPHCKKAAPVLRLLRAQHPRHLRLVFRHFPLEGVHPHALGAALAAEAAGAQGKFWAMHDLLFENQSHLKPAQVRRYAERLELDMVRYDAETGDTVHLQRVREDIEGGERCGVRATPSFFLNGKLVDVSFGLDVLRKRVEDEVASCGLT